MINIEAAMRLGAFDLDVAFASEGGIVALFGRSGTGKTATINVIAGLARPARGRIVLDGRTLLDTTRGLFVPAPARRIGVVFQNVQLFPHLTVRQNLLFGRWFAPKSEPLVAVAPLIETLGIGHLLDRRPARLSGGESQRVAIGRALVASPRILLLDEPLAALDSERKAEILPLIERLRDEFGIPIIYVSHAVEEVARLANQVVVIEAGRVVASGTVEAVFANRDVQAGEDRFSRASFITGKVVGFDAGYRLTELHHPAGTIWLVGSAGPVGRDCRVIVRATDVTLALARPSQMSVRTVLAGTIGHIQVNDGPLATVVVDLEGHGHITASATRLAVDELDLSVGRRVFALIKTVALDEQTAALLRPRTDAP